VLVYPKVEIARAEDERGGDVGVRRGPGAPLQGLRTQMEIRPIRSARERILQSLRLRAERDGCWQPDGTLQQFAEAIGLTHEALYRALATLEEEGRIDRDQQRISLL
jgi:DNA-binding transcriptional ArsR family regulator